MLEAAAVVCCAAVVVVVVDCWAEVVVEAWTTLDSPEIAWRGSSRRFASRRGGG